MTSCHDLGLTGRKFTTNKCIYTSCEGYFIIATSVTLSSLEHTLRAIQHNVSPTLSTQLPRRTVKCCVAILAYILQTLSRLRYTCRGTNHRFMGKSLHCCVRQQSTLCTSGPAVTQEEGRLGERGGEGRLGEGRGVQVGRMGRGGWERGE